MAKEVWDKPNPKKKSTSLTPAAKALAKAAAKKAGRKYPNLVDNMRAAQKKGK
jgi:ribosomal protein L15E